jgi:hypothetical protein
MTIQISPKMLASKFLISAGCCLACLPADVLAQNAPGSPMLPILPDMLNISDLIPPQVSTPPVQRIKTMTIHSGRTLATQLAETEIPPLVPSGYVVPDDVKTLVESAGSVFPAAVK